MQPVARNYGTASEGLGSYLATTVDGWISVPGTDPPRSGVACFRTLRLTGYTGYLPATAFEPITRSSAAPQEPAPHFEPGYENGQLQLRSLAYLHVVELDAARSHSAIIVMKTRPILGCLSGDTRLNSAGRLAEDCALQAERGCKL